jgi:hypothetical protein
MHRQGRPPPLHALIRRIGDVDTAADSALSSNGGPHATGRRERRAEEAARQLEKIFHAMLSLNPHSRTVA